MSILENLLERNRKIVEEKKEEEKKTERIGSYRKKCFAILSGMEKDHGFNDIHFWNFIKEQYGIESRSELTEGQWRGISERLSSIADDPVEVMELSNKVNPKEISLPDDILEDLDDESEFRKIDKSELLDESGDADPGPQSNTPDPDPIDEKSTNMAPSGADSEEVADPRKEISAALDDLGEEINPDDFWSYVLHRFNVKSEDDLPNGALFRVATELQSAIRIPSLLFRLQFNIEKRQDEQMDNTPDSDSNDEEGDWQDLLDDKDGSKYNEDGLRLGSTQTNQETGLKYIVSFENEPGFQQKNTIAL